MSASDSIKRERAAQAIAEGKTQVQAAEAAGVAVRTVARWHSQDNGFRQLVRELRRGMRDRGAGHIARELDESIAVLVEVRDQKESLSERRRAAQAIADYDLKCRQLESVEDELARQAEHLRANDEKLAELAAVNQRLQQELANVPLPQSPAATPGPEEPS